MNTKHSDASQAGTIDACATLAVFYTVLTHYLSTTLEDASPANLQRRLDLLMRMLEVAAEAVVGLKGSEYSDIVAELVDLMQEARAALNDIVIQQQRQCSLAKVLPPLSHEVCWGQLQPFTVAIPAATPERPDDSANTVQQAISNLAPISCPHGELPISAILKWFQATQHRTVPKATPMQMLLAAERWFYRSAMDLNQPATGELSPEEAQQAHRLATLYCQHLLAFEQQYYSRHSCDVHTDMLKVELRSRETLVVWVMLCLAHRHAAAEFPGMKKYLSMRCRCRLMTSAISCCGTTKHSAQHRLWPVTLLPSTAGRPAARCSRRRPTRLRRLQRSLPRTARRCWRSWRRSRPWLSSARKPTGRGSFRCRSAYEIWRRS